MNRLFFRISVGVLLALLVSKLVMGFIVRYNFDQSFSDHLPFLGLSNVSALTLLLEDKDPDSRERYLQILSKQSGFPIQLVPLASHPSLPEGVREGIVAGESAWRRHGRKGTIFAPMDGGKSLLVIGPYPQAPAVDAYLLVLSILLALLIVGTTGYVLTAPVVRRLKGLEVAAARITAGELHARAEDNSNDAIGSLARQFNEMAECNQGLLERQRQILQAVSHELRTPTARIRFSLEMLSGNGSTDALESRLQSIDEDLLEIDELVHELLLYNRFDSVEPVVSLEDFDATKLTRACIAKARKGPKTPQIELDAPESCIVSADRRAFKRVVNNLLDNAIRYAETLVEVRIEQSPTHVDLIISDNGPGIPEEHRERVLQPFACLDESRNRGSGGAGLGLAIVERILKAHQGDIEVLRSAAGGASIRTRWPADGQS